MIPCYPSEPAYASKREVHLQYTPGAFLRCSTGAYGIPQALPGSKMASAGADWETNPVTQIRWMAGYVSRYGGWQGAINFWYAHGWY